MASESVITLTDESFEKVIINSKVPVLVDFWATWCGPCRAMSPIVDSLAEEYKDKLVVGKVNVDECEQISSQFRIASIPTIILFVDGVSVEKVIGVRSADSLRELINKHL